MRIRITQSMAGPVIYQRGQELVVGGDIEKAKALSLLNSGLAVAIADVGAETAEYPVHTGGGWYRLSDGSKVQGKEAAAEAEQRLNG